ncbi:uncharacterized protein LOC123315339 [Coccinella septempunctata]|uniref:uncharacterized protein LOC123315339 n=1 Tax=Coccinella septempunctata TaxID=41139 RepID=UPI001D07B85B|nr:uncharacterized protein LOC123315339 [Coccinella septempunctata]
MSKEIHNDVLTSKFIEFSKYQSRDEETTGISLRQIDLWLRQASILDMNHVTPTDTGTIFFKFGTRTINFQQFLQFLRDLVSVSGHALSDILKKLEYCEEPMEVEEHDFCEIETISTRSRTSKKNYLSDLMKDI